MIYGSYEHPDLGIIEIRIRRGNRNIYVRAYRGRLVMTVPGKAWIKRGLGLLEAKKEKLLDMKAKSESMTDAMDEAREKELVAFAKQHFPEELALLAAKHGFKYNSLKIKRLRSKWGSCSSAGNINLSAYMAALPRHLREYVMLHELCHTRQMNHGPLFWAEVKAVCPGYMQARKDLKNYNWNGLAR